MSDSLGVTPSTPVFSYQSSSSSKEELQLIGRDCDQKTGRDSVG